MLSYIADTADLIAAAAVVASLVFVALEIRQTNRQAQLSNWRDLLEGLRDFKAVTNDPVVADIITRGHQGFGDLAPHEQLTFGMYLEQGIHIYGNFTKHADAIPDGYDGLEEATDNSLEELLTTPGARAWWAEARGRGRLMKKTIARIDGIQAG